MRGPPQSMLWLCPHGPTRQHRLKLKVRTVGRLAILALSSCCIGRPVCARPLLSHFRASGPAPNRFEISRRQGSGRSPPTSLVSDPSCGNPCVAPSAPQCPISRIHTALRCNGRPQQCQRLTTGATGVPDNPFPRRKRSKNCSANAPCCAASRRGAVALACELPLLCVQPN